MVKFDYPEIANIISRKFSDAAAKHGVAPLNTPDEVIHFIGRMSAYERTAFANAMIEIAQGR